jgi:hypothetical protein
MKRILLAAVAALGLAGTGHAAFTNQAITPSDGGRRQTCYVADPDNALNVRTSPNGEIIGVLTNKTEVDIKDRKGKWVFVQSWIPNQPEASQSGWVYRQYLVGCHVHEEGC